MQNKKVFTSSPKLLDALTSKRLAQVVVTGFVLATIGCGANGDILPSHALSLNPSIKSATVGETVEMNAVGVPEGENCSWGTSDPKLLAPAGEGVFHAMATGSAAVTLTCGSMSTTGTVTLLAKKSTVPATTNLIVTQGGVYSGSWSSSNYKIPAVSIRTDEPVTLQNSVLTGRGDLIDIQGINGANVTIQNVTGTALDPAVNNKQRGTFIAANKVNSLVIKNTTVYGASYGIQVLSSKATKLQIQNNVASNLEDRASDGNGGLKQRRPSLGHFIFLQLVSAPNGADISWNQMINTIGSSSTEDVINIYKSQGSAAYPIVAHDNYMEGYSSPATAQYTGSGVITDGDALEPVTAYVAFNNNEMVHTAGSGVVLAAGHNLSATSNRVVSCGQDTHGNWFAMPYASALLVYNFYGSTDYGNINVQKTTGGMVRPDSNNKPMIQDIYTTGLTGSDTVTQNSFTDPCLVNGKVYLQAEANERAFWAAKLKSAAQTLGDTH